MSEILTAVSSAIAFGVLCSAPLVYVVWNAQGIHGVFMKGITAVVLSFAVLMGLIFGCSVVAQNQLMVFALPLVGSFFVSVAGTCWLVSRRSNTRCS